MLQPLARSLHNLRNAADAPSLADAVERSLCDRGFIGFLFYDVARPLGEGAVIRNFDDGLVARYDHLKLWKMDPLGVQGSERRQPIVWDARYPAEYREQELLWDPLIAAGFRNFIAIPIYGPTGRRNIFVGFAEKFRRSARVTERVIDEFVVIAYHMASFVDHQAEADSDSRPRVTPREIECLQWTARGKTAWEIATILGIAERTVNFHLSNVMGKLEVPSKHQAALKALRAGLFDVD